MIDGMIIDAIIKFVIKLMLNFILDKESRNKHKENYKN